MIRVTPFRVLITLLISHLLSPLGLQVGIRVSPKTPEILRFRNPDVSGFRGGV